MPAASCVDPGSRNRLPAGEPTALVPPRTGRRSIPIEAPTAMFLQMHAQMHRVDSR